MSNFCSLAVWFRARVRRERERYRGGEREGGWERD
jgi:hypothetical protein